MASATHYEPEVSVRAAGRDWTLYREADFDSLWNSMASGLSDDEEDHIPYWTELWPSSIALANWLTQKAGEIAGQRCIDLGCGLGLTALAASSLGARVTAIDYEEPALHFARKNAEANGVSQPLWTVMDWRRPAVPAGGAHRIWGGDIMYERRFVGPVLNFLAHALAPDGRVWIAEPGRRVYDAFLSGLSAGGWTGKKVYTEAVEALYAQSVPVTVAVWELRRANV